MLPEVPVGDNVVVERVEVVALCGGVWQPPGVEGGGQHGVEGAQVGGGRGHHVTPHHHHAGWVDVDGEALRWFHPAVRHLVEDVRHGVA